MKLRDYLAREKISAAEFARRIGAGNRMTVTHYVNGTRIPGRDLMARIVETTGGAVGPKDFYDLPEQPSGPPR